VIRPDVEFPDTAATVPADVPNAVSHWGRPNPSTSRDCDHPGETV
jgi:hypothetical protein